MFGIMMDKQLNIADILEYAAQYNTDAEIVTRQVEGGIHRYRYHDALLRTRQLANALRALGVHQGDRVATLAWNTYRHFELYYAVSGMGAVIHTINPRLFAEQIVYIVNHAEDKYVFVDLTFVPLLDWIMALRGTLIARSRFSITRLTVTVRPEGTSIAASTRLSRTSRAPVAGSTRGSTCATIALSWRVCPGKLTIASIPGRISAA